jgi:hypothetical protein
VPEAVEDPAIGGFREAARGDRRPRYVSAQTLQSAPIAGGDADAGVEAEALNARAERAGHGLYLIDVDSVAEP